MSKTGFSSFSIATLNVGGFKSRPEKIAKIYEEVKNFDVVIFQETHFSREDETYFFQQVFAGHFFILHSYAEKRFSGICMLFSQKLFNDKPQIELKSI